MGLIRHNFPGVYTTIASSQTFVTGNAAANNGGGGGGGGGGGQTDPTDGFDLWGFQSFGPMGITVLTFSQTSSLGGFDFEFDTDLVELHFPNLASIDPTNLQNGFLTVISCSSLTTLDMPVFVPNNGGTYDLHGNALNVTSVNNFLHRCVLNAGFVTGSVNLTGGTNAAPSGQGATDKTALIGRGVTVTTN